MSRVGGEKGDHAGDLAGLAQPAERRRTGDLLDEAGHVENGSVGHRHADA
ncbi:hypothetical protein [Streptomyces odontomachi]|nr:hypothetical protein [Streptomyces sp. ODS25]